MNETEHDPLVRLESVRRGRRTRALSSVLSSVAAAELLFASFAFGYSKGPSVVRPDELAVGIALSLVLGVAFAFATLRRRFEARAAMVASLREGRSRRRVAVFEEYLTVDREIVLGSELRNVDRTEGRLVLRYDDPRFKGPVLRELEGEVGLLSRLEKSLGDLLARSMSGA